MVFKSDRQRRAFFSINGGVRSPVNPTRFKLVQADTGKGVRGVFAKGKQFRTRKQAQAEIRQTARDVGFKGKKFREAVRQVRVVPIKKSRPTRSFFGI